MKNINLNNMYEWPLTLRLLIFGLVGALVFYLLYLWDISSLETDLINAQQKEQDIKQQLEVIVSKQIAVKKETTQFPKIQSTLLQWQKKFITYAEVPQLINEILKAGAANHLYFNLFTPGKEVKVDGYFEIPIKIIISGNYHDLATFLSQVANLPTIVVIRQFTITSEHKSDVLGDKSAATAQAERLLTAEVTLEAYYLDQKNPKKMIIGGRSFLRLL